MLLSYQKKEIIYKITHLYVLFTLNNTQRCKHDKTELDFTHSALSSPFLLVFSLVAMFSMIYIVKKRFFKFEQE